ncbi:hypothetical protein ABIA33_001515 [Streptacidiphilus sp. MAP12-16]|uniref:hypothetical protein n=1 Tax=Streptacidiphilus sp. MAP12-16 TaxID=3156300 RepID=UPI00351387CF
MAHHDARGDALHDVCGDGLRDELRGDLKAEAASHRPDREAMLARIERGRREPGRVAPRRGKPVAARRSGFRVAGTAAAVAAVLGLSVAGTWAAVGHYTDPRPVESSAPARPAPQVGTATSTPARSHGSSAAPTTGTGPPGHAATSPASAVASATATATATASSTASPTASTRVQQGFLWSDGSVDPNSIDNWSQSDITLKNHETITALDVRLRVALTPALANTGAWSTVPAADLVTTVTRDSDALVYEFTLKPGATLTPGTYEFAGQYNHASGGRDAGQDTYWATATARTTQVEVFGNFYATH